MLGSLFPRAHVVDCSCSATRMAHCEGGPVKSRQKQGREGPGGAGWVIGLPNFVPLKKRQTNLLLLLIRVPPNILTFYRAVLLPNVLHTSGLFIHVIEGLFV